MLNIILFGPPGSGKGTQANFLKEEFNLIHISTGDLLRSEIEQQSKLGLEARDFMKKGMLVPDTIIIGMIGSLIDAHKDANGIICDGFPRTTAQAEALDSLLKDKNETIAGLVELMVEDKELEQRILERGKTSGRVDDQNIETVKNRITVYKEETAPVADYYKAQDKYIRVNGQGSISEITERLVSEINKLKQHA